MVEFVMLVAVYMGGSAIKNKKKPTQSQNSKQAKTIGKLSFNKGWENSE